MSICNVCFRHCDIKEGGLGFCGARSCRDGRVVCANYGQVTSLALDPIEKKPLARFYPGSLILSAGSYGCNLRCPFCQNSEISWSDIVTRTARAGLPNETADGTCDGDPSARDDDGRRCPAWENDVLRTDYVSPEELAATAEYYKPDGNIGIAFTYNEALIGWEYVRDAAKLAHERGLKNVVVTNGTASLDVLAEIAPYVDAMNIDLKGFTDRFYKDVLGGDRRMVMDFIEAAVKVCHVELTTLIIPGGNDSDEEMSELSAWVAGLAPALEFYTDSGCGITSDQNPRPSSGARSITGADDPPDQNPRPSSGARSITGADIPLHVTRFFPCFHMTDRGPTDVAKVLHMADVAHKNLHYVYPGNI